MRIDIQLQSVSNIDRERNLYTTGGVNFIKTIYADDGSIVASIVMPPEDVATEITPELLLEYIAMSRDIFKSQIDVLFDLFEKDSSTNIAIGGALGASITKVLYDYTIVRGTSYND